MSLHPQAPRHGADTAFNRPQLYAEIEQFFKDNRLTLLMKPERAYPEALAYGIQLANPEDGWDTHGWGVVVSAVSSLCGTGTHFEATPIVHLGRKWRCFHELELPADLVLHQALDRESGVKERVYRWSTADDAGGLPNACDPRFLQAIRDTFERVAKPQLDALRAEKAAVQKLIAHFNANPEGRFCNSGYSGAIHYDPIEGAAEVSIAFRTADIAKVDRIIRVLLNRE